VLLQHRARASRSAVEQDPRSHADRTHTVYVIDDDASVRRSLARLLRSRGHAVRSFASAEEFLAQIDATVQGCLLVDVNLEGIQGPELQSLLTNARWPLPIIAMSGSRDRQTERAALREGARAFLRKPFDATALLEALAIARA